jgi:hypothetical protein
VALDYTSDDWGHVA